MTFGMTLAEHLTKAASVGMFYIAIDYENKPCIKNSKKKSIEHENGSQLFEFRHVFVIEVKTKSKYRILNFLFQFIKNTKWHFGYTDSSTICKSLHSPTAVYTTDSTFSYR